LLDLGTMGNLEWAVDNEQPQMNQPVVEGYFNVFSASCANLAPKDLSKFESIMVISNLKVTSE